MTEAIVILADNVIPAQAGTNTSVIPAQAGTQGVKKENAGALGSRLRGNDEDVGANDEPLRGTTTSVIPAQAGTQGVKKGERGSPGFPPSQE